LYPDYYKTIPRILSYYPPNNYQELNYYYVHIN